jgi:hypothetical protein
LFNGPIAGKTTLNGDFKSKSHDNLNKSFSASFWQATFDKSDPFAQASSNRDQPIRSRTSPNRDRSQGSAEQSKAVPMTQSRSEQPQKHATNGWTQSPKDASWAAHPDGPPQQTNRRSTRSPKNPVNPAKPTVIPQPASVTTEAQEEEITLDHQTNGTFTTEPSNDPEAMEIDDEPVSNSTSEPAVSSNDPSVESRHVPGEPSRPGWQPSMMGGQDAEKSDQAHVPMQREPAPPSINGTKINRVGGKDGLFDLNNMNNVAPFAATNSSGIGDLGDIHANLPFESQSSNQNGIRHSAQPRKHPLPNPPKRPRQPTPAPVHPGSQQKVLSRKAWDRYVSEFHTYMREWNDFSRRILQHFNTRQEAVETGLSPGWINAVGDSNRIVIDSEDGRPEPGMPTDQDNSDDSLVPGRAAGGFAAYFRAVEEDFRVRYHWNCACELHRDCLLELNGLREWIRNGGKVLV